MQIADFIKNNQKYFEDFITRSTYHSNAIEGNTLSYAETYAIIFNDNSLKINAQPRDIYEAINHKYAIDYILKNLNDELTQKMIIDLAVTINKNIAEIGGYRTCQVLINKAEHIPPAPQQVSQMMMYFVHNYNHTEYESVYQKAAANHIEFERIHPFGDGNGRTGRLLVNYEMLRNNLPPIVINKDDRALYFDFIASGNVPGLAAFFEELSSNEAKRMSTFEKICENTECDISEER